MRKGWIIWETEEKTRVCAKTHFGLGIEVFGKTYVVCGIGRRLTVWNMYGQTAEKARASSHLPLLLYIVHLSGVNSHLAYVMKFD